MNGEYIVKKIEKFWTLSCQTTVDTENGHHCIVDKGLTFFFYWYIKLNHHWHWLFYFLDQTASNRSFKSNPLIIVWYFSGKTLIGLVVGIFRFTHHY